PKDVLFHLLIPALGLVPEVNASFEQFLHRYCGQTISFRLLNGDIPRFSLSAVFRPARSKARFAPALRNGKRPHTNAKAGEHTSSGLCAKETLALGELEPLTSALLAI